MSLAETDALQLDRQGFDVVTLGETMIRFSPVGLERLEQAVSLEVHVGGSESNTAVGLARLGWNVCWLSRLTDNPLGRKIVSAIAAQHVDTSHVVWTNQDRIGTYYFEQGVAPRASAVVYDRAASAFSRYEASELLRSPFRGAKLFHATGISMALGETTRRLMSRALEFASEERVQISFDFNFRSKLWTMADARRYCNEWVRRCDVLFMARRDAAAWLEVPEELEDEVLLRKMAEGREGRCTVLTLGARGAIAWDAGQVVSKSTRAADGVGRLGGGDAFSAGFLCGWLHGWSLEERLRWGNAAAGIKYSIPGDLPLFSREEIAQALQSPEGTGVVR